MPITQNKKGAAAIVVATGANDTITTANLALAGETVDSFSITKLFWSTTGTITLARGANVVLSLTGSDHWPLDMYNIALGTANTADLVITVPDANSSIVLELKKSSSFVSEYFGRN